MTQSWHELLSARCDEIGVAGAARELDYSRAAISMARGGKYPGGVARLAAAVVAAYSRCRCPYLGAEIAALECRAYRARPLPQSNSERLRFWAACAACPVGKGLAELEARARPNGGGAASC